MSHHPRLISSAPVAHGLHSSPEPLSESVVALNIASRREELHRNTPSAITLAAAGVFAFHAEISGNLTTALRSRSGSYAREQGTGLRALTVEDICELVTVGGSEGRCAVRALLAPVLAKLDEAGAGDDVVVAAADFLTEACDVPNAIMLGKSGTEINREIREARESLRKLEKAQEARDRMTAPLADVMGLIKAGGRQ